ncbi:MAG: hypothetical protein LUQ65_08390 [Candidatus Helarchaeota archaeon]|nr:hypothetical protein [Candidatus Helarchaeota archaeon]
MNKLNCWEFKKCERQEGGAKVQELGVCPAATERKLNSVHGGKNAGRACWVVAGTLCTGQMQGTFTAKYNNCIKCEFYKLVREEEKKDFLFSNALLEKLRSES